MDLTFNRVSVNLISAVKHVGTENCVLITNQTVRGLGELKVILEAQINE